MSRRHLVWSLILFLAILKFIILRVLQHFEKINSAGMQLARDWIKEVQKKFGQ